MGLDQYAYIVIPDERNTNFDFVRNDGHYHTLCEWRKHPNLQGWMEKLFNAKADKENYVGQTEQSEIIVQTMTTMPDGTTAPEGVRTIQSMDEVNEAIKEELNRIQFTTLTTKRIFNQQAIRLTMSDLDQLEMAIKLGELPETKGFFFGGNADEEYKEDDLKFIKVAQEGIRAGLEIYYSSWW